MHLFVDYVLTEEFWSQIDLFSRTQCNAFEKSSLPRQCEILFTGIENQSDIFDLIKSMSNLQVLIIRCNDDQWKDMNIFSINDALVE
ncbi:unnamed protein product [Rotaria sp. Silwood2]|nr:unnamed protein product [Rotaria sp. Silwood2]CAF3186689.1 unnamed protein product [Rotaria sp. Silwood2]CAF3195349.1 unnamed protein product [Rotaria sp. Silwood2]CAF3312979.1 unnamed protein product [Rotaria sp. Silwood2]CAF4076530.1 unnamed protein product [Rotaria sp. Silwood2]